MNGKITLSRARCPISRRNPEACVYPGFLEACARFRIALARKSGVRIDYCNTCGAATDIAVLVGINGEQQQEKAMGYVKKIEGICEQCGVKKGLISHFQKKVCPTCSIVRTSIKNKPEIAIAVLREFGKMPEQAGQKETGGGTFDLLAENNKLRGDIAKLRTELDKYVALVKEYKDRPQADETDLDRQLEEEKERRLNMVKENLALKVEVERLNAVVQQAAIDANKQPTGHTPGHMVVQLRDLAWRLADGVMTGEIQGVTVDDIRILRQAA